MAIDSDVSGYSGKRNHCHRIDGDNAETMTELINTMKSYGYKVELYPK